MTDGITRLTRQQVREVDRRAIEQYHVPGIVLMENAARNAADVAWDMIGRKPQTPIDIICGGGNNGGDGLAVARHLCNRGAFANVFLTTDPQKYAGDALINWRIARAMKLVILEGVQARIGMQSAPGLLVIDALLGTGLTQPPRPEVAEWIEEINYRKTPVLAIDLPSGLDCDTGLPLGPCVRATKTVTFVAEKSGFAHPASRQYTGDIIVADIGCPDVIVRDILWEAANPSPP